MNSPQPQARSSTASPGRTWRTKKSSIRMRQTRFRYSDSSPKRRRYSAGRSAASSDVLAMLGARGRGVGGHGSGRGGGSGRGEIRAQVVAEAEVLLQPAVHHDEEVAAAHLLQLELGLARLAVAPGDRHDGPGVASHRGLQRDLDRQVEVRGEERAAAVDDLAPVRLEGVG